MVLPVSQKDWGKILIRLVRDPFSHNAAVKEHFRDVQDSDETSARALLQQLCLVTLKDTANVVAQRQQFFYNNVLRTPYAPNLYTMPLQEFQQSVRFSPQVKLHFKQNRSEVQQGFTAVTGQISFRLMQFSSQTINPSEAEQLGVRIRSLFGGGEPFQWHKGKELWLYKDPQHAYKLQLYVNSKSEAEKIIERVVEVQGHPVDLTKYLHDCTTRRNLEHEEETPTMAEIYGKERRLPRKLPNVTLHFQFAELHVHHLPHGVCLFDGSGTKAHPLVTNHSEHLERD